MYNPGKNIFLLDDENLRVQLFQNIHDRDISMLLSVKPIEVNSVHEIQRAIKIWRVKPYLTYEIFLARAIVISFSS